MAFKEKNFHATFNANWWLDIGQICVFRVLRYHQCLPAARKESSSYKSQLIFTGHCNVSNPGKCLVTTLFNYLQIPNLHNTQDNEPFTDWRLRENTTDRILETQTTNIKCITWMPDTVKYGISNFTRIGAFFSWAPSSAVMLGRLNSALHMYS